MLTFLQPDATESDTSQKCPICGAGQPASPRYPDYVCADCVSTAVDELGRELVFYNTHTGDGILALYRNSEEKYLSRNFLVRGLACCVSEARFGGIVVRLAQK